jgi:hypothetical protein
MNGCGGCLALGKGYGHFTPRPRSRGLVGLALLGSGTALGSDVGLGALMNVDLDLGLDLPEDQWCETRSQD